MSLLVELDDLLDGLLDERLTAEEKSRLEELLETQGFEARKKYFKYVDVQLAIVEQAELELASLPPQAATFPAEKPPTIPTRQTNWLIGTIGVAVSVLFFLAMQPHEPAGEEGAARGVVNGDASRAKPARLDGATNDALYFAEIGATSQAIKWANDASPRDFLMRLGANDSIDLAEGIVTVEYYTGASLLLQGPCRFRVTGESSGYLEKGRVTGRVAIGDFVLNTPTAEVVDLGTEFGASVDESLSTEIFVFDGSVSLTGASDLNSTARDSAILLSNGMAARATTLGKLETTSRVNQGQFARSVEHALPSQQTDSLSLIDLVNESDEGAYRLAMGIAPDTGGAFYGSLDMLTASRKSGRGIYHVTSWHPTIDGVFIPSRDGRQVQVDSTGGGVDLPPCGANTNGPIWSRRRIADQVSVVFNKDFWGRGTLQRVLHRLRTCEDGMIGLHANVGMTIDLQAIRDRYERSLSRFRVVVANLDNSPRDETQRTDDTAERRFVADFRLFVDGDLRRSRLAFGRSDGDMVVATELKNTDRFLTIVASDAGHYWYDQVVLIDPAFELAPLPPSFNPL